MSAAASIDPTKLDPISSEHYERNGYPFAEWAWLRQHDPVSRIQHPDHDEFWAITKHADIIELVEAAASLPQRAAPGRLQQERAAAARSDDPATC